MITIIQDFAIVITCVFIYILTNNVKVSFLPTSCKTSCSSKAFKLNINFSTETNLSWFMLYNFLTKSLLSVNF